MSANEEIFQTLAEIKNEMEELAKKMDAKSRRLAKKMHKLGVIYCLYGALDGLSLSYSMIKYLFDMHLADTGLSPADEMHDWLVTPTGIILAGASSIFLILFSVLGNYLDDEDKVAYKRYIALLWPFLRDAMKGLKNAYKGFKSTLNVSELLSGENLNYLIFPIGLTIGILAALNRIWLRWMVTQRKDMMKANANLLDYFKNSSELTLENLDEELKKIQSQTTLVRATALFCAAYGGVVDGLYLYVGVLGLCSLTPATLIAMTVFCAVYFLACIATRIYEEYDYQQKLLIAQAKIELAYEGKRLELLFNNLQENFDLVALHPENKSFRNEQQVALQFCEEAVANFREKQTKLRSLTSSSYMMSFLWGAKNGLAAYGALASVLFVVGMIASSFPPALLVITIALGMALFIGFIAHALISNYLEQEKQAQNKPKQTNEIALNKKTLLDVEQFLKNAGQEVQELRPEEVKIAILDGMVVDSSPQFFFQEWFEVIRSFFSGLNKGVKAIDLTLNPLEAPGTDGHYHESSIMVAFMVVSSCFHALTLALRALSRGFGRPSISEVAPTSDEDIEMKNISPSPSEYEEDLDEDEFQQPEKLVSYAESSRFHFFNEKQVLKPKPRFKLANDELSFLHRAEDSESDHCTF